MLTRGPVQLYNTLKALVPSLIENVSGMGEAAAAAEEANRPLLGSTPRFPPLSSPPRDLLAGAQLDRV